MGYAALFLVSIVINMIITALIVDINKQPKSKQSNLATSFVLLVTITCALAFSNYKLLEVLDQHGIEIPEGNKRGTIILKDKE